MEGGKTKQATEVAKDIPDNIKLFRSIINNFKRKILNQTEVYNDNEDIQDMNVLNGITRRIKQFGIYLNMVLDGTADANTENVKNHFAMNSFLIANLTDEEKDLCRHYIKIDIFMYPYDLRPGHINSSSKVGDV